jgi:3-deoxy-D-manno-octulosonic-acid transferase
VLGTKWISVGSVGGPTSIAVLPPMTKATDRGCRTRKLEQTAPGLKVNRAERLYRTLAPLLFGMAWTTLRLSGAAADSLRSRRGDLPAPATVDERRSTLRAHRGLRLQPESQVASRTLQGVDESLRGNTRISEVADQCEQRGVFGHNPPEPCGDAQDMHVEAGSAHLSTPSPTQVPLLWFHGASAGEMTAAVNLARLLRRHGYRFTAGFTTTNRAGLDCIRRLGGGDTLAALAPWDAPRWVERALERWQPAALFLVETELWPSLILAAARRNLPAFCVSARIYPRDVAGYRLIRSLIGPTLCRLTGILAQDEVERERFLRLGAPPQRSLVAGNLKHLADAFADAAVAEPPLQLGRQPGEIVVICGSIHADETEFLLDALARLPRGGMRTVMAPRRVECGAAVAAAAAARGWRVARRTAGPLPADWEVLVLDTIGELPLLWRSASVAVVGGGFGRHGGHNPFEPLRCGVPVLFGPHFGHFQQEAVALKESTPEAQVTDANELAQRLRAWVATPEVRLQVLTRQRRALPDASHIAQRYMEALSPWLDGVCA